MKLINFLIVYLLLLCCGFGIKGFYDHQQQIKEYLFTEMWYEVLLQNIVKLESNGDNNAVGDGGLAKGVAQFHRETFYGMVKLFNLPKTLRWEREKDQLYVCSIALKNKMGREWVTYDDAIKLTNEQMKETAKTYHCELLLKELFVKAKNVKRC